MATTIQGHEAVGGATKRGPPDTSVKVPDGVKAAAERADALVKQAAEAKANAPAGADQPIGASLKPPAERVPTGVVTANFDPNDPNPPRDVPSAPQAAPPAAPQPQTQEDWEHQFKSLKGRYDRDSEDKRNMSRQLQETQRLLASLSVAPSTPPNGAGEGSGVRFAAPPPPGRKITPQEVTEYGNELLDVVARRAQEVTEPVLAQVISELNQLKRSVGGVQNTVEYDARVRMYEDLAHDVPNWDQINNSAQFAQWLDQPDPISGAMRRNLLNMAHNGNLAGRVIAIFRGFLNDMGYSQSNGGAPANGAGNGAAAPQRVDLAAYAAPGKMKPGGTEVPGEKPIFNAVDIPAFYRDKTAGKYAGREAEMNALEAALFEAGREGRIRR
jgi:hypothetical protein